ncbi:DUF4231 domain-containing protein [Streptomyces sp. PRKS01-29]|nr:DUF4231 domain-containing protein [Streptomyces sabulosicollis]
MTWYEWHKRRQRRGHYLSEAALLLLSASIPACAAAGASVTVTGVLGALVVASAGLRQLFRWRENSVRAGSTLMALQGARQLELWGGSVQRRGLLSRAGFENRGARAV